MKQFLKPLCFLIVCVLGYIYHLSTQPTQVFITKEAQPHNTATHSLTAASQHQDLVQKTSQEATHKTQSTAVKTRKTQVPIYIHLTGAVKQPGVYQIAPNTVLFEMLQQAGGALKQAALNQLDLSRVLASNQKIHVPFAHTQLLVANTAPSRAVLASNTANTRVNINHATASQLCELPGIGTKTAAAIIAYRQQKGPFKTAKDLLNIKGLGEKKVAKFKNKLRF